MSEPLTPEREQPEPAVDRIPLTHSVRYVARGLPDVPNQYGPGVLAPSEITLTYRAASDSQLGRVRAYVAGRLRVNGVEIPLLSGGLYGQYYDDGVGDWPEWLAEEARLHDPDTVAERIRVEALKAAGVEYVDCPVCGAARPVGGDCGTCAFHARVAAELEARDLR